MVDADLYLIESLLTDPDVMKHYPNTKTRGDCRAWIARNQRGYAQDGFGLWILENSDGDFIGECGLTWQPVDGQSLEVGYHVLPAQQGRGYATEAAKASIAFASSRGIRSVIAVITSDNHPSVRVAQQADLSFYKEITVKDRRVHVYRIRLQQQTT